MASRSVVTRMVVAALGLPGVAAAQFNTSIDPARAQLALMGDRSDDCPPCFNCKLPAYSCGQFSPCNEYNGQCVCPEGFGGMDCLEPLCGSLAKGANRVMRNGKSCECDEGWAGINCNVCTDDRACNALMETGDGGVCHKSGQTVRNTYQMCDVTNRAIVDILNGQIPQVTFECKRDDEKRLEICDFQFWVDERESFMCHLLECQTDLSFDSGANRTKTWSNCNKIECECIPDRMLCGENGSVDITDFLKESVAGPASFECTQESVGPKRCAFKEPGMNDLISDMFGDSSILLTCSAGECLYHTEVPGYEPTVPKINTPLIAGVIAGTSLFLVAVILMTWYLSRRKFRYGPIHLDESDDDNIKLMVDHKPASLYFENVTYDLNGKRILAGIQGIAHPGEVMAIMGASGAGKSTFLDILARKNKRGTVGGDFFVNGEKVGDAEYKTAVGFVDQEDVMLPTLTVHETILTSALLRLPRDMGRATKEQRVYEVEKQLGIHHIRDSLIGSEDGQGRGISGGEKRRVGIACELVTSPSILFLDEPTSGLDAYNAYNVIECLVTLAKTYKRTVIFTIHQPRSNIVALFDRLILLAQGQTVFSGLLHQCQDYFDRIGYNCPPGFNIADYLVDLTMHAGTKTTFDDDGNEIPTKMGSEGPSSTRAVKSIASMSEATVAEDSGVEASSSRPRLKRRDSVKARQERELFTRRKRVETAASSDAGGEDQNTVRLQRQQRSADNLHLPPSATGTDLDILIASYMQSDIAGSTHQAIEQATDGARTSCGQAANGHARRGPNGNGYGNSMGKAYARVGYFAQFAILSQRTWRNLYRNPMLMLTHYAIAIVLAVFAGYLFYGLTGDIAGFQNRLGLFFFVLALFGFSTLTSLGVFASERLLFLRERANGYYSPITYFAAKVMFDTVPLRIIPPILLGAIIYPMTGLMPKPGPFFIFVLVLVLFNLAAAAICLFIGIVCRDAGVANLVGSLVMLFSLLFTGLLLNHDAIPAGAIWLQWLSIFHYAFEALIVNEVAQLTLVDRKYGLNITVPGAAILSTFGFNNGALWMDVINLAIFGAVFMVLAYGAMHFWLVEKR